MGFHLEREKSISSESLLHNGDASLPTDALIHGESMPNFVGNDSSPKLFSRLAVWSFHLLLISVYSTVFVYLFITSFHQNCSTELIPRKIRTTYDLWRDGS